VGFEDSRIKMRSGLLSREPPFTRTDERKAPGSHAEIGKEGSRRGKAYGRELKARTKSANQKRELRAGTNGAN